MSYEVNDVVKKTKSKYSLIMSIAILVMQLHFLSLGFTWSLNKAMGWGLELVDYYGMFILVAVLSSLLYTLIMMKLEGFNTMNIIALIVNLISVFYIGCLIYTLLNL